MPQKLPNRVTCGFHWTTVRDRWVALLVKTFEIQRHFISFHDLTSRRFFQVQVTNQRHILVNSPEFPDFVSYWAYGFSWISVVL